MLSVSSCSAASDIYFNKCTQWWIWSQYQKIWIRKRVDLNINTLLFHMHYCRRNLLTWIIKIDQCINLKTVRPDGCVYAGYFWQTNWSVFIVCFCEMLQRCFMKCKTNIFSFQKFFIKERSAFFIVVWRKLCSSHILSLRIRQSVSGSFLQCESTPWQWQNEIWQQHNVEI